MKNMKIKVETDEHGESNLDEIEEKGQLKTLCKQLLVENVALRKIVNK